MIESGGSNQAKRSKPSLQVVAIIGLLVFMVVIIAPAIGKAKARSERERCAENLKQLVAAWSMYLNEYSRVVPANILSISNAVGTPKLFVCPSDKSRGSVKNFADLLVKGSSYQASMPSPGEKMPVTEAQNYILMRCSIHDNAALTDGSVHMVTPCGMSNLFRLTANGK